MSTVLSRSHIWIVRLLWLALPFTIGNVMSQIVQHQSPSVSTAATVTLWAIWGAVLTGTLITHPMSLTALRITGPAIAAALVYATVSYGPCPLPTAWTAALIGVVFLAQTGELFVNGPSYPNEHRYLLRPPGPLLLGPLQLSWALVVALPLIAIYLLADGHIVWGALCVLIGLPVAWLLARSLYGLSRRWLVFVPAGIVVHDPITLTDPVLFPRNRIALLHPAEIPSDALDLSQVALGRPLEMTFTEEVSLMLMKPGLRKQNETRGTRSILVAPTRPGAVLRDARSRSIAIEP